MKTRPLIRSLQAMLGRARRIGSAGLYKARAGIAVFVYLLLGMSPALADDIDIYTMNISTGGSGAPVILFQLDSSGSMMDRVAVNGTGTHIMDQRAYRMVDVAKSQITGMNPRFKSAINRYVNPNTGMNLMKARSLDTTSQSVADITVGGTSRFPVRTEFDDALQSRSAGIPTLGASTIRIGWENNRSTAAYGNSVSRTWGPQGYPIVPDTLAPSDPIPVTPLGAAGPVYDLDAGARGNVVIWYYHTSSTASNTFTVSGATLESILYLTREDGTLLASNNGTGNNSAITYSFSQNTWYRLVVGTVVPSLLTGTFTITRASTRGNWYPEFWSLPMRAGFRFTRVDIPRGATITNAYLQFDSSATATAPAAFNIARDTSPTPQPLTSSLFFRPLQWQAPTGAIPSWDNDSWSLAAGYERDADSRMDVTTLVQNQVNQAGWCSGEAVFVVQNAATPTTMGTRTAQAFEVWNDRALPTELVVEWSGGAPDPACAEATRTYQVTGSSDDVAQSSSGVVTFDATAIPVGLDQKGGFRFQLVDLPQGAVITDARLQLVADVTAATKPLQIQVVDAVTSPAWDSTSDFLDSLSYTTDVGSGLDNVSWVPTDWTAGVRYTSPNLAGLIQPLFDSLGWAFDNTIGIVVSGTNATPLQVRAWERPFTGSVSTDRTNYGRFAAQLVLTVKSPTGDALPIMRSQRQILVDALNELDFDDNTPIAGTFVESAQFMLGRDGYEIPPLADGDCATNAIVFLTDGEETGSSYSTTNLVNPTLAITGAGTPYGSAPGKNYGACGTGDTNAQWNCVYNMMRALYDNRATAAITADWDEDPGTPNTAKSYSISTYAIGFGPEANSTSSRLYLSGNQGGGAFKKAADAAQLNAAFREIISTVSISTASVAAPGVAVNALNKFEHLDELYYALFDPENKVGWKGNLKRYRLKDGAIVDMFGEPAISATTGLFGEGSSWWSDVPDNGVSLQGGAGGEVKVPSTRKLYTYLGTYGTSMNVLLNPAASQDRDGSGGEIVHKDNAYMTETRMGVTSQLSDYAALSTAALRLARRNAVIEFLRGGPDLTPRFNYGALIHSAPSLVTYGVESGEGINTVFVSDIEGVLHMIDTGGPSSDTVATNLANTKGTELFAFVPQELLPNAALLHKGDRTVPGPVGASYIYGLDGTWIPWKYDVDGDGNIESADGDKVYLYGGMRRGGSNLYALDVTTVRRGVTPAPQLAWVIEGGKPSTAYANMGQTWGDPSPRWIKWNGVRKRVVFFTGGYDAIANDNVNAFPGTVQKGRQIYMVDAVTGALMWWASSEASANTVVPDMKYSMPAAPVTLDRNGNGSVDGLYVTDIAGQVFRFDFNEAATSGSNFVRDSDGLPLNATGMPAVVGKFGHTGSAPTTTENHRRFFDTPAVAFARSSEGGDLMIALTSGMRETPADKSMEDKVIVFRDKGAWNIVPSAKATLTLASLAELGSTGELDDTELALPGWYMAMNGSIGEKGTGSPVFFNFALLFTTFVPGVLSALECAPPVGYSRLYAMNALTGAGIVNDELATASANQRYVDQAMPGMGSTVQMLYMGGDLTVVSGVLAITTEALEDDTSDLLDPAIFGAVRRSRWFEIFE